MAAATDRYQQSVLIALHRAIDALGVPQAAKLLGLDRSTVARRMAHHRLAAWSAEDIVRLCLRENRDAAERPLLGALTRVATAEPADDATRSDLPLATARQAIEALCRILPRLCDTVADARLSDVANQRLLDEIDRVRAILDRLATQCGSRI